MAVRSPPPRPPEAPVYRVRRAPVVAPPDPRVGVGEGRKPRTLRYHRDVGARPLAAGEIVVVGLVMFALAGLLNADSLYALANRQPIGWKRDTARSAVAPVRWLSHGTGLHKPREWILEATGKDPSVGTGSSEFVIPTTTTVASAPGPKGAPGTRDGGGGVPPISLHAPTAADPLDVYVGGDSMVQELGGALVAKLDETEGYEPTPVDSRVSTGLTRPDYFDWPKHLVEEVLPADPEIVVMFFGANDAQGMEIDGAAYAVRTPEWQAEYRRRVGLTMDLLGQEGRLVVWLGTPHMGEAEFDERQGILDTIYREEAAKRPFVRFVDSRAVLSPPGGGYSAYLPDSSGDQQLARQRDGIHLTRFGADLLAGATMRVITQTVAEVTGGDGGAEPSAGAGSGDGG